MYQRIINIVKTYYPLGIFIMIWTASITGSMVWNIYHSRMAAVEMASNYALAYFNKDQAFREWGASHGGVYVPIDEHTRPNPYLSHVMERDLITPSGKKLTLMNPAYMLRQFQDKYKSMKGASSHITSLRPLNPENKPDEWESAALSSFEIGKTDAYSIEMIGGKPSVRFMRPMLTQHDCLKCHGMQGYKVGEVRGGVSVSVPISPFMDIASKEIYTFVITHGLIYVMGLLGIMFAWNGIRGREIRLRHLYKELKKSEKERKYFAYRLIEAQELDNRKVSVEIHEGVGQSLSAIKYIMESAELSVEKDDKEAVIENIRKAVSVTQLAIDEIRLIEKYMSPSILNDLGILPTVSWFCKDFNRANPGIRIQKKIRITEDEIPKHLRIIIFRVIQEAFTNSAKHGKASLIYLLFNGSEKGIELSIEDNGVGMETEEDYFESFLNKGFGLASIKGRVELSQGNFKLSSEKGKGVRIEIFWPYSSFKTNGEVEPR